MAWKVQGIRDAARGQRWFREFEKADQEERKRMVAELKKEQSAAFLQQMQRGPDPAWGEAVSDEAAAEARAWLDRVRGEQPPDLDAL